MESIKDKVAVVGMGCTKFGENWEMSANDMIIEAAYEAYEDDFREKMIEAGLPVDKQPEQDEEA